MRSHVSDPTGEPGPHHVVGGTLEDRLGQPLELARVVLTVGVTERHHRSATRNGLCEPGAHGGPESAIDLVRQHRRPGRCRPPRGVIGTAVVDNQAVGLSAQHLGREAIDHRRHTVRFVVRRQQEVHRPRGDRARRAGRAVAQTDAHHAILVVLG